MPSAAPQSPPPALDPALLRLIEALARHQARKDYAARLRDASKA